MHVSPLSALALSVAERVEPISRDMKQAKGSEKFTQPLLAALLGMRFTSDVELRISGPMYRATYEHSAEVHRRVARMAAILLRCGRRARSDERYGYVTASGYVGHSFHQITYMPAVLSPDGDEATEREL
jgi:hypothetical protein